MVLNSEFWDALTGNQRRKFAKANCEATYKKAIQFQIISAVLGMRVVGLFLPIANKSSRYWKGYYSLREEEMPFAAKVLCALNFIFGLFANIVLMIASSGEDYGMFVNTMSRRKLEAMLNETDNVPVTVGVRGDDPFRIGNMSDSVLKVHEPKPARRGCENVSPSWLVAIDIAVIAVFTVAFALIFSSCGKSNDIPEDVSSADSSETVSEDTRPNIEDFGELSVYPQTIGDGVTMRVNSSSGLNLRKGPTTKDEVITKMPDKTEIKVYNYEDVDNWYFVEYTAEGQKMYGWACAKSGDDWYIVTVDNSGGDDTADASSQADSSAAENLFSAADLKKQVVNLIKAVNDAANDFVGYLECNNEDTDSAVFFGSDSIGEYYYKVTNAKTSADLKTYLSKYMITSLVNKESEIPAVTDTGSVPESPVVSYNGALYISATASVASKVDISTLTVLSSNPTAYVVSVMAMDDENNETKFTINFQYKDEKFTVTSFNT